MATCLKRTSKLFDPSLWRSSSHVNLRDLLCPVCRGILIEPVTLPCEHNLCLRCLNGTVEHNNLNCPLCRTRVGSWLRTASKSKTLVNNRLWDIIRSRFPKEVEGKINGDEGDIDLDTGYAARTKILSAAGEIRKEYEVQLQLAEEEKRQKQEAEAIASETLIRKLQAEEQQHLAQLKQDELLAKTLAKEEINVNVKTKRQGESSKNLISSRLLGKTKTELKISNNMQKSKTQVDFANDTPAATKFKPMDYRKTNIALISKIRAERYASSINSEKTGSHKPLPVQDAVTRLFKNQVVTKFVQPNSSSYSVEPSCSNSKIYGTQSKEELHVPNDVLNCKKKSLGVEICLNTVTDDPRIGSAESAGSHDSINQEIHHFKPIEPVSRTPLKTNREGRQIDTKLIRVIPIIKRVSKAVPKPPTPTRSKRTLGCSWSAFRGKILQDFKTSKESKVKNPELESDLQVSASQTLTISSTLVKPQASNSVRKLDPAPEMSFDTNKNYAKNINKIINGTKVSKKLNLEEGENVEKVKKSWETQVKNGSCGKVKHQKNAYHHSNSTIYDSDSNTNVTDAESMNSTKSDLSDRSLSRTRKGVILEECAVENIAERIKKRKTNRTKPLINNVQCQDDFVRRSSRKRVPCVKYAVNYESLDEASDLEEQQPKQKRTKKSAQKLQKEKKIFENPLLNSRSQPPELMKEVPNQKKKRGKKPVPKSSAEEDESFESVENSTKESNAINASDDEVINEQRRIEILLLQEQKDRELAERLQAQFNELESMAGRTRNSRRAIEGENVEDVLSLRLGKRGQNENLHSKVNQTRSSKSQRQRPQERALK